MTKSYQEIWSILLNNVKNIDRKKWIQLALSENLGFSKFSKFFTATNGDLEKMIHIIKKEQYKEIKLIDEYILDSILNDAKQTETEIFILPELAKKSRMMRFMKSPPLILFARGNIDLLSKHSVSIVGAREAIAYNEEFAKITSAALSKNGYIVISGMARGIDAAAHYGAFPDTIGIIANGISFTYPPENSALYRYIPENGGLILSEYPVYAPPLRSHFFSRNRVIAGLSIATVVIEAARKSGSMSTAQYAIDMGRDICACPGFAGHSRYSGNNQLIQDGAYLINNIDHFIEHINTIRDRYQNSADNEI